MAKRVFVYCASCLCFFALLGVGAPLQAFADSATPTSNSFIVYILEENNNEDKEELLDNQKQNDRSVLFDSVEKDSIDDKNDASADTLETSDKADDNSSSGSENPSSTLGQQRGKVVPPKISLPSFAPTDASEVFSSDDIMTPVEPGGSLQSKPVGTIDSTRFGPGFEIKDSSEYFTPDIDKNTIVDEDPLNENKDFEGGNVRVNAGNIVVEIPAPTGEIKQIVQKEETEKETSTRAGTVSFRNHHESICTLCDSTSHQISRNDYGVWQKELSKKEPNKSPTGKKYHGLKCLSLSNHAENVDNAGASILYEIYISSMELSFRPLVEVDDAILIIHYVDERVPI